MTTRRTVRAAAPLAGTWGRATLQEQAVTLVVPTDATLPVLDRDDLAASLGKTPTCPC